MVERLSQPGTQNSDLRWAHFVPSASHGRTTATGDVMSATRASGDFAITASTRGNHAPICCFQLATICRSRAVGRLGDPQLPRCRLGLRLGASALSVRLSSTPSVIYATTAFLPLTFAIIALLARATWFRMQVSVITIFVLLATVNWCHPARYLEKMARLVGDDASRAIEWL